MVGCLVFANENCGISGSILVTILEHFDGIDLFPWLPGGAIPMLIVDGNQSQLDPQFIEYINNEGRCWKMCLDEPYAIRVEWEV